MLTRTSVRLATVPVQLVACVASCTLVGAVLRAICAFPWSAIFAQASDGLTLRVNYVKARVTMRASTHAIVDARVADGRRAILASALVDHAIIALQMCTVFASRANFCAVLDASVTDFGDAVVTRAHIDDASVAHQMVP